jgi:hypothetical protein
MNPSEEPLARRLRNAAIDRTHRDSERVDDYVLDPDGVIDLRELDREKGEVSIAAPAAILATIRGQLGDAATVSELYAEAEPEPEPPRWRLDLRARNALAAVSTPPAPARKPQNTVAPTAPKPAPRPTTRTTPISRLSLVPMSTSSPTEAPPEATPETTDDVVVSSTADCGVPAVPSHRPAGPVRSVQPGRVLQLRRLQPHVAARSHLTSRPEHGQPLLPRLRAKDDVLLPGDPHRRR